MATVTKKTRMTKSGLQNRWRVTYEDLLKKQRTKDFHQKKAAHAYQRKIDYELERGVHVAPSASIRVAEAARLWLNHCAVRLQAGQGMRRSTLETYEYTVKNHILPQLGPRRLGDLNAAAFQTWAEGLMAGPNPLGAWRIKCILVCMGEIIAHAQRHQHIGHNVMRECRPRVFTPQPERIEIPSREDMRVILKAGQDAGRIGAIVAVAALTGLRVGEIRGLVWPCVDFHNGTIRVDRQANRWGELVDPKSRAGRRTVPMGPGLFRWLKTWKIDSHSNPKQLVFCSRKGRALTPSYVRNGLWVPFMRDLGMVAKGRPRFRFHALRHFAASLWIAEGVKQKRIQEWMGHKSITLTFDTYGHLFTDDDSAARSAVASIEQDLLS